MFLRHPRVAGFLHGRQNDRLRRRKSASCWAHRGWISVGLRSPTTLVLRTRRWAQSRAGSPSQRPRGPERRAGSRTPEVPLAPMVIATAPTALVHAYLGNDKTTDGCGEASSSKPTSLRSFADAALRCQTTAFRNLTGLRHAPFLPQAPPTPSCQQTHAPPVRPR